MGSEKALRIRVTPRFQRSVHLELDMAREDALDGYVPQASPLRALAVVAEYVNGSRQRAFTWTGPYGGGKSTLALALAQLAGGTAAIRKRARAALSLQPDDPVSKAFGGRKPWSVIPVVGRRQSLGEALIAAIDHHVPVRGPKRMRNGHRDVVAELIRRADSPENNGLILVLDELGKLLEASALAGEDIYLLQELAEAAAANKQPLIIIGVLHQAFEQYAVRGSDELRNEWAKIQGRFVDIPIVAGTDEVIDLIGDAIHCEESHPKSLSVARAIAASIHKRRPSSPKTLADALDRCWPLHPVTAALLGPCSRRRFGQNERSVFGFLGSAEPLGFRDFLEGHTRDSIAYFDPARFWDYLRANFEPAILASADGHRWATSAEAIERVEARFAEPHVSAAKTIAVIELFRNGSGLASSNDVLTHSLSGHSAKAVTAALADLQQASVIIHRKHVDAWGIYAGSDFDIDAAVSAVRRHSERGVDTPLRKLGALPLVTARKHYSKTGALRWFDRLVVSPKAAIELTAQGASSPSRGRFLLLVDSTMDATTLERSARELARSSMNKLDVFGIPHARNRLMEYAGELDLLEHVATSDRALESDGVARREIAARLQHLRGELDAEIRSAFASASWVVGQRTYQPTAEEGLAPLASRVCDAVFKHAPHIVNELVNRDTLSSSAAKAQRLLMHRMLSHSDTPALGYVGYPADAGLYYSVIAPLGLHREVNGLCGFHGPDESLAGGKSLLPLWTAWREELTTSDQAISLAQWFQTARQAPYGVKAGLLPILALAFLISHRSEIAVYVEGMFSPELSDADIDEWLQDPTRISWKWVHIDTAAKMTLTRLAACLAEVTGHPVAADPLDSARALVAWVLALPGWTQRTSSVSNKATMTTRTLLRASDPVKTIFADLPEVLGSKGDGERLVGEVRKVLTELASAYPRALKALRTELYESIDTASADDIRRRAEVIRGISGDLRLEAFVARLMVFAGRESDIESLVALATNKSPRDFTDNDLDQARVQISQWAFEFRRIEALASVRGLPSGRRAMAVVFGGHDTISATIDVSATDTAAILQVRDSLLAQLKRTSSNPEVFLAALVEAGSVVLGEMKHKEKDHG